MSAPLVSILVPCYNAAPYLAETLQSALDQTWSRIEIIVVDDGSSDDSLALARSFEARGVKVYFQSNAGAAAARNRAFRESRGEFVQYLDADDLISPTKIERQLALLATRPAGWLATCAWGRFRGDWRTAAFVDDIVFCDLSPVEFLVLAGKTGAMMHPSAWLVPRAVAERAGPWTESLSLNDDGEYFCRVALASSGLAYCGDADVRSYYRSGIAGSLSQRRSERARRSQFESVVSITDAILATENSPRTRQAAAGYWRRFVHDYYPSPSDLIARAMDEVARAGEELGRPPMGPKTAALARLVGWKAVWRLKEFVAR